MADPTSGKVPVLESMAAAWRFFFANWTGFLPACIVIGVVTGLSFVAGYGTAAAPAVVNAPLQLGVMVMQVLASVVFSAAVLRKALRDEYAGPLGLAFGADEIRLLGVFLSLLVVFGPLVLLLGAVLVFFALGRVFSSADEAMALMADPDAFSAALVEALGPAGSLAYSLFVLLAVVIALVIGARLFMVNAATMGERRIVVFQTWSWSRGNVLRILAAMVITMLPAFLVTGVIESLVQSPIARGAVVSILTVFLIGAVSGFVSAFGNIPMLALAAHLYKGLRPPEFVAK